MSRNPFLVILFLLLMTTISFPVFSQNKPRLGILPFTGGAGEDGETIATLFSLQKEIENAFTIVPRTGAVNTLLSEQKFQMSGYTDSDTISNIGRMLNADFVVSGHIRSLGGKNLIIITIINVQTFEQLAGDYHVYNRIEEVRSLLPKISEKIISSTKRNTSWLPKLAVVPFNVTAIDIDKQEAETLAQILAVEISNTGKYAVLPRTSTMQTAMKELEFQMQGYTAEEGAKALGRAINAEYILSADVRKLGNMNLFTAQILHVEEGRQITGGSRDYRVIDDGIKLMAELAILLADPDTAASLIAALNRQRFISEIFKDPARFWSVGVLAGTSFATPMLIGTFRATLAPFKYQFLELGFDYGIITLNEDAENYYSMYPFVHYAFFMPLEESIGLYAGAGGGYMIGEYTFPDEKISINIFALDVTAGIKIWSMLDVSYTLRTDFKSASNKVSVGYTYRFR